MKKFIVRMLLVCALVPSMFMSAAKAVGEDAECLSVEIKSGAIFSVCLEGEVNKARLSSKIKSELLELAHQLKRSAAKQGKASSRRSRVYGGDVGPYGGDVDPYGSDCDSTYGGDDCDDYTYETPDVDEYAADVEDDYYQTYMDETSDDDAYTGDVSDDYYQTYTDTSSSSYGSYSSPDYGASYGDYYN